MKKQTMRNKSIPTLASILMLSLFLFGCANNATNNQLPTNTEGKKETTTTETATPEKQQSLDPVTLTFYVGGGTLTDTEFDLFFVQPTKEKFPHITLEKIVPAEGVTPAEVLLSNDPPDIIYQTSGSYYAFQELEALADLTPLAEKYAFDTNRIKPYLLESVYNFAKDGELFTLPFSSNLAALFYNKDIFDKFHVPYPSDEQVTWDEILATAQQLTRNEDGVQYIGIDLNNGPATLQGSYGVSTLDPESGEPILQSEQWRKIFETVEKSVKFPGYVQGEKYQYDRNSFVIDQNLAMRPTLLANLIGTLEELRAEGKPLNWGLAPIPNFEDNLGQGKVANVHSVSISSVSKHQDEAFQVLANILSDEVQRKVSRNGRVPAIDNPELDKEFGADIEVLKGIKIENIFKTETPVLAQHRWENDVSVHVTQAFTDIALNGIDVNTAIRTAEDNIRKDLETLKVTKPE
ncbi:MAG: extracellular solute-binding protein [Candidatus Pristimantibacillus lignocellulolyticus]|uniref:Extracellular solute-binding protein n=1 Tax=Candidatus Pristimantibacillus lignocellulolyticus TaxID=2994561 RepID=A0A9J6ZEY3_9BACL|nr:MAG: extracellular solute-binding protein [Candidatus Pristimantibacillus lignocellulolyticus]